MQKGLLNKIRAAKSLNIESPYREKERLGVVTVGKDATYLEQGESGNPFPFSDCLLVGDGDDAEAVIVKRQSETSSALAEGQKFNISLMEVVQDFDQEITDQATGESRHVTLEKGHTQLFATS